MLVRQIPLAERIADTKKGYVSQAEFCACLIQRWAKMPIRAYFGYSKSQWQTLARRLGLDPSSSPTYQEVASMIHQTDESFTEELLLLATPIWEVERERRKHESQ